MVSARINVSLWSGAVIFDGRYFPLRWKLFLSRSCKANCHVLQVLREMTGHQQLLAGGD